MRISSDEIAFRLERLAYRLAYRLHRLRVRAWCACLWATRRRTRIRVASVSEIEVGSRLAIETDLVIVVWMRRRERDLTVVRG